MKKKLGVTESDADLYKAVLEICWKMKVDRDKSRVAFYYLLAEKYGKLAMFHCAHPLPPTIAARANGATA